MQSLIDYHKVSVFYQLFNMRKVGVIINMGAGTQAGPELCDRVKGAFNARGVAARVVVASGKELRQLARAMLNEGFDCIAAGGGDGTVSTVASELVGQAAALGVLPLGTLNHFAQDLGLPMGVEEAVEVICSGKPKKIDVGAVNGHIFINNSSLGLYPDQVRIRQKWRTRVGKWLALVIASFIVLLRFTYLRVTAEINGKLIWRRCPLVLISNNEYRFVPGDLTGRDRLDAGKLGIYLLNDEGRTGLLRIALHSLVFSLEEATSFESHTAQEVTLMTRRRKVRVALDGEVVRIATPLRYRSVRGGLNVISPSEI